jgi:hypothetical protein
MRALMRLLRENGGHIQNEDDGAIAKNGRAADEIAGDDVAWQGFDDQLFFPDHAVHDEAEAFFGGTDDNDEMFLFRRLGVDGAKPAKVLETDEREDLVAELEHFALIDAMDFLIVDPGNLHDRGKRDGEKAATNAEKQRLNAGERQRGAKLKGCAARPLRGDLDCAF